MTIYLHVSLSPGCHSRHTSMSRPHFKKVFPNITHSPFSLKSTFSHQPGCFSAPRSIVSSSRMHSRSYEMKQPDLQAFKLLYQSASLTTCHKPPGLAGTPTLSSLSDGDRDLLPARLLKCKVTEETYCGNTQRSISSVCAVLHVSDLFF